jgi:glycosyltransferase involved in cell wall biosynthesis
VPAGAGTTVTIGSVGRLAPEKNYAALVDAVRGLRDGQRDVRLVLAGDGPMRDGILARAAQLGVQPHVTLLGELADVRPALRSMDLFALPSRGETFSNAALEAMASGLPVVMSGAGGGAEMIRDGIDGLIFDPADGSALGNALARLCADAGLRAQMGRSARQRAQETFGIEAMVDRYSQLINAAAAPRPALSA